MTASENIKDQLLIVFGVILILIIIISIAYPIYFRHRRLISDVIGIKRKILEIQKSLNLQGLFSKMDIRLNVLEKLLEKRNKKGQLIDPRIIWIIVLLVLLYLFFKIAGVLP